MPGKSKMHSHKCGVDTFLRCARSVDRSDPSVFLVVKNQELIFSMWGVLKETHHTGASLYRPTVTHCRNGIRYLICCYSCFLSQGKEVVLESEVQVLSRLRHPNVVKLYDVIDASSILCLVLELVEVNNAKQPSIN